MKQDVLRKIDIVIPCYNEETRINIEYFIDFVEQNANINLWFVDDGSTDQTKKIIKNISQHTSGQIKGIFLPSNVGKAEAIRTAFTYILKDTSKSNSMIGYLDADLSVSLEEMIHMSFILSGSNKVMIMGSRIYKIDSRIERSFFRKVISVFASMLVNMVLKIRAYDTQCGAKLFIVNEQLNSVVKQKFCSRWLFDVEIILRVLQTSKHSYSQKETPIIEFPLKYWSEKSESKIRTHSLFFSLLDLFFIWNKYINRQSRY